MLHLILLVALAAEPPDAGALSVDVDAGASCATDLRFSGNRALPEAVYRAVLELPPCGPEDDATAATVHAQLDDGSRLDLQLVAAGCP